MYQHTHTQDINTHCSLIYIKFQSLDKCVHTHVHSTQTHSAVLDYICLYTNVWKDTKYRGTHTHTEAWTPTHTHNRTHTYTPTHTNAYVSYYMHTHTHAHTMTQHSPMQARADDFSTASLDTSLTGFPPVQSPENYRKSYQLIIILMTINFLKAWLISCVVSIHFIGYFMFVYIHQVVDILW